METIYDENGIAVASIVEIDGVPRRVPPPRKPETTPRTQALTPQEIRAAREAIAQAEEQARRSTSTVLRDALLLLSATFDGVLAKLGGEQ